MPPSIWQIASGETGRIYTDLFLDHDVMFCGPSKYGLFDETLYQKKVATGERTASKIGMLRTFVRQVRPDDIVLLRAGHKVVTIGVVEGTGYSLNQAFDDVYGWDVEHTHRVIWQEQFIEELENLQRKKPLFAMRKQIPMFTAVKDSSILDPIRPLFANCNSRQLKPLPAPPAQPMDLDSFGEELFNRGLSYDAVHRVKTTLEKQRRLIDWYGCGLATDRPSEHEIVAHIILPLLIALGWSEQLLAVEWHKVDLAVFSGTPTDRRHCALVCEAKAMGHGLQDVLEQAKKYVDRLQLSACNKILLADGGRFYLYRQHDGSWEAQPHGYLNVMKLRQEHVCPKNTNAVDTLVALTPHHLGR